MIRKFSFQVIGAAIFAAALTASPVSAQTVATTTAQAPPAPQPLPRKQIRRVPLPPARVTVISSDASVAPQVVTIVHRLSGVKILRLLLRQNGENGVVETIDPETLTSDAHASIIAGWVMDDGKTIAARLPQAAAEIELADFERAFPEMKARAATTYPFGLMRTSLEPDLWAITADGKKLRARLVGLDAETGLSILQVTGLQALTPKVTVARLQPGEALQIFAPEPAAPEGEASTRNTYVKVGKIDATVSTLTVATSGMLDGFTVQGAKLTPDVIGGIACDQSGMTIGIVDSIEGDQAKIVGADRIRAATRRVLARKASVPRPLLGVRGEPVDASARAAFLANGWRDDQVSDLIKGQVGILLTSIAPGTPAAMAKLQPGDVIIQVNQTDVKSAEEFSKLLGEAGSGEQVRFTIRRPAAPAPFSVPVTLGGSFSPMFERRIEMTTVPGAFFGLRRIGIQTMALTPRAALRLGAQNGFLVVAVQENSAAARGGIREGDVIESVDGKALTPGSSWTVSQPFASEKKHTLSIIRSREKKQIVVEAIE